MVNIMRKEGLPSSAVSSHRIFLESVVEKLLWSSIFWLLSAALGGIPVGLIATQHREVVHELVAELLPLAMKSELSESSIDIIEENLCTYCMAIEVAVPSIAMAISEFEWRNGWFLRENVSPCHVSWLQRACRESRNSNLETLLLDTICMVSADSSDR